jgi:CheY-like chemotaxis protein
MIWHIQYRDGPNDYMASHSKPERAIEAACLLIDHGCEVYGIVTEPFTETVGRDEIARIHAIWARAQTPFAITVTALSGRLGVLPDQPRRPEHETLGTLSRPVASSVRSNMAEPKHILAVDDSEVVRQVIAAMLEKHGCRVTTAEDGTTMRERLGQSDPVDAIILDALMPGEPSDSLARYARSLSILVVMISGNLEMINFAESDGLQLLQKPFGFEELTNALTQAFESGQYGRRGCAPGDVGSR